MRLVYHLHFDDTSKGAIGGYYESVEHAQCPLEATRKIEEAAVSAARALNPPLAWVTTGIISELLNNVDTSTLSDNLPLVNGILVDDHGGTTRLDMMACTICRAWTAPN